MLSRYSDEVSRLKRRGILSLDWSEIHFELQYAHLDLTKNGEERDFHARRKRYSCLSCLVQENPTIGFVRLNPEL